MNNCRLKSSNDNRHSYSGIIILGVYYFFCILFCMQAGRIKVLKHKSIVRTPCEACFPEEVVARQFPKHLDSSEILTRDLMFP